MTATVDDVEYPCTLAGASGLICPDGNSFGFHLNPRAEDTGEPVSIEGLDQLTVTVSGLSRFSTERISYWDIY